MTHSLLKRASGTNTIALIGCGGTGCQVLSGLARIHLALKSLGKPGLEVVVIDPDMVTRANLGRQLFSPADIGHNKAEVLIARINNYFGLNWKGVPEKFNSTFSGAHVDIVIGCVDSRKSRNAIKCYFNRTKNSFSYKTAYYVDCGNTNQEGQVLLGTPSLKPNNTSYLPPPWELFPDLFDKTIPEDNGPSCSLAEALIEQDLFINQKVATCCVDLLWQLLKEQNINHHGFFINAQRTNPLPIDSQIWKRMCAS